MLYSWKLANNSLRVLGWLSSTVPVEIKMVVLGKSDGKVEMRIYKFHLHTRVDGSVVGGSLEHSQSAFAKGQFLDSPSIKSDPLSNRDDLVCSCELEGDHLLAIMEDGDSNGSQPSVVPSSVIGNKVSIHYQLIIADEVEGVVL